MLSKCQGYLIFKWEASIFIKLLKEKELAFATSAFIITDLLEAVYAKKSDVICFCFPPRCDGYMQIYIFAELLAKLCLQPQDAKKRFS